MGALLGLALVAVLSLIALAWAWRAPGRAPRAEARRLRAVLVLAAAAGSPWLPYGMKLGETSSWQCDLCGLVEHRDACAGIVLRRSSFDDPCAGEVLAAYGAWAGRLAGDHGHAWDATLSSYRFPCISCTMLHPCRGWFERLPRAPPELARRAFAAFAAAEPEARRRFKHEAALACTQGEFERWLAESFP